MYVKNYTGFGRMWLLLVLCLMAAVPTYAQLTLSADCETGTTSLSSISAANLPPNTSLTWHTASPTTDANKLSSITAVQVGTYYAAFYDAANGCYSSANTTVTVAPALCITNTCSALTANLNTALSATNLPSGTTLTWHTSFPATTANKIADPTSVGAGKYYAAYFDAANNCYSGDGLGVTEVIVKITPCLLANPNVASTNLNTPVSIPVLGNDTRNGVAATISTVTLPVVTTAPGSGTTTVNPDGSITFTPATGFTGTTTFVYRICDAVQTTVCDTALVSVNVGCPALAAPTNLLASPNPICAGTPTTLSATTCSAGVLTWYSNSTLTTTLPSTTVSPTTTTTYYAACVSGTCKSPASSVVVTVSASACVQPQPPIAMNDIVITPQNKPASGNVLTNDTDPEQGSLTVTTTPVTSPTKGYVTLNPTGTFTYTPYPLSVGEDKFCYEITDNQGLKDTACVVIEIVPTPTLANDAPIAMDDNTETPLNTPVILAVKANDKDPEGLPLSNPTAVTPPSHGTVVYNSDGTVTYTPNTGFIGTDSFVYSICDTGSPVKCDSATVTVLVKLAPVAGNQPPVAMDDATLTNVNTPVSGTVAANDSDPDHTAAQLTYTKVTDPLYGTVTQNANGSYTYTPTTSYVGNDRYTYKVCDPLGKCDTATVTIAILPQKVALLPKVYLQGALFGVHTSPLMRDDLRVLNLIPLQSPYPVRGLVGATPTSPTTAAVLQTTGDNAIVDWVFVELRSATNSTQVLDSRSALLQRDGDIVEVDGVSAITFNSASAGSYYVVIRHRNHLSVMSQQPIALTHIPTVVDFRNPQTPTYTRSSNIIDVAQVTVNQGVALWAGNSLYDNQVVYQGSGNDVNSIYQRVITAGSNILLTPYFILKQYSDSDINMNGEVIFQGSGNDLEYIYLNVTKNHPGNLLKQNFFIIREQLP